MKLIDEYIKTLEKELKNKPKISTEETGIVSQVKDGVVILEGLDHVAYGELIEFRKNAERVHKEVDKFLKRILARMWKKNIRGEIYNLTVNLYNASKFNWNDIEKFKEFYNFCLITLEQLSKLYKPAKS